MKTLANVDSCYDGASRRKRETAGAQTETEVGGIGQYPGVLVPGFADEGAISQGVVFKEYGN